MTLAFITGLYLVFANLGYFTFGFETLKDCPLVTQCMPPNNPIIETALFLWVLNIIITYPMCLFPAHLVIESYLYKGMEESKKKYWLTNFSRTILVIISIGVGIAFSKTLDKMMSLVGSVTCAPIAFIFPAGYHLALSARTKWEKALDIIIMAIGVILLIFGTVWTLITWNSGD